MVQWRQLVCASLSILLMSARLPVQSEHIQPKHVPPVLSAHNAMNSLTWLDSLRDPLGFAGRKNPVF